MNRIITVIAIAVVLTFAAFCFVTDAASVATLTAPTGMSAPASPSALKGVVYNVYSLYPDWWDAPITSPELWNHIDMVNETIVNIPDANLSAAIKRYLNSNWDYDWRFDRDERGPAAFYRAVTGRYSASSGRLVYIDGAWTRRAADADITLAEMLSLTSLDLGAYWSTSESKKIQNLAGLEWAVNLTSLDLGNNRISDVTSLSGLTKLTDLTLLGNGISDVTPLAGLTSLTSLDLWGNRVSDVTSLSGLTKLTDLNLSNNGISDVTALAGLTKLTRLYLGSNEISDVTSLSGLTKLTYLNLFGNQISDVTSLAGLTKLTRLYLRGNEISEIAPLNGLQKLESLDLVDNPLNYHATRNIEILESNGLRTIRFTSAVNDVPIQDALLRERINKQLGSERASDAAITSAEMLSLTRLNARGSRGSRITDLRGLSYALNLTRLDLADNNVTDVNPLAGLTKLEHLYFAGNHNLSDITVLSGLSELYYLDIWRSRVSDLSVLSNFKKLGRLQARATGITDVSVVARLPEYYIFALGYNGIRDLSPFVANPGVGWWDAVYLLGNPLSYDAIYTQIPVLKARGTQVTYTNREPGVPVKSSGDAQTGTVETTLASPLVVQVNDTASSPKPFEAVPITWAVTGGGGSLQNVEAKTDVNGLASASLLLGSGFGANTVTASLSHNGTTRTLTFTATAGPAVQRQEEEGEGDGDEDELTPLQKGLDHYRSTIGLITDRKIGLSDWRNARERVRGEIGDNLEDMQDGALDLLGLFGDAGPFAALTSAGKLLLDGQDHRTLGDQLRTLEGELIAQYRKVAELVAKADDIYYGRPFEDDEGNEFTFPSLSDQDLQKTHANIESYDVSFYCWNPRCNVPFSTAEYGGLALDEAGNAHLLRCEIRTGPDKLCGHQYYARCPNGKNDECGNRENHYMPCRGGCGIFFPTKKISAHPRLDPKYKISIPADSTHVCHNYLPNASGTSYGERCGNEAAADGVYDEDDEVRYDCDGLKSQLWCSNWQEHAKQGACGHYYGWKDRAAHAEMLGRCPYEAFIGGLLIPQQCSRDGYFDCEWWHGNNSWSGHIFTASSPSQQDPPAPVPLPDETPPETPAPETPAPETPEPDELPSDDDDDTPPGGGGDTPPSDGGGSGGGGSGGSGGGGSDDGGSDEEEEEEEDEEEEVVEEPPEDPPPPPPPPVLCGNRWRGPGACEDNRRASYPTSHRTTCSGGHKYWGCNRTADAYHKTRVCGRSGCGRYYTRCTNGPRGNNRCPSNPGGWHAE